MIFVPKSERARPMSELTDALALCSLSGLRVSWAALTKPLTFFSGTG
jgi:hypothetical protein